MLRSCILCLSPATGPVDLCRACLDLLPEQGPACDRCASPLLCGQLCGACVTRPPPFSRARVPFLYAYPLDALIKAAKFSNRLDYLNHLGRIMADRLRYRGCSSAGVPGPGPAALAAARYSRLQPGHRAGSAAGTRAWRPARDRCMPTLALYPTTNGSLGSRQGPECTLRIPGSTGPALPAHRVGR